MDRRILNVRVAQPIGWTHYWNGITRVPHKLDPAPALGCHDSEFWDAFPGSLDPELTTSPGRPQSIPPWAWPEVFRLREQGLGYRRVAAALLSLKVWTTKSSVERLIKGLPPYQGGRPAP